MRSGQQNKRGRGRNNNQRKSGNPLSRTYDSTGPDVKIRGTAQHIADKYAAMARDALGSGDTVMAENYLQHAEHYNRIIAAAQAQMQERYQRDDRDNADREQPQAEGSNAPAESGERETSEAAVDGSGPQPVISGTPAEVAIGEDAVQPARRTPSRRRTTGRPRRARGAENGAASEEANGSGGAQENAAPVVSEAAPAPAEATETTPEVAAAPRDA
ncbi:DUF4167 domain-containing protein [Hoeflea prorocentri]|uniref:DUF4167 domain-containing protein n=1 Tax=Hoeflea prorocentri TaxID=1922333 RepID=A0A9X3ZK61_9HYPH|nr:DUF4167 domain-containing protein [Hoeflea prorocentri]MCY6383686.1 DUF4167 domain-containing protein [Hoeflea prorocentri]MDA5401486.1 DUF4167 domain-containing protein [Hoeflea prorocentri]